MRASTANRADTTSNPRALLSVLNPLILELTDQVVLTFQPSDIGETPNTDTHATSGEAESADQPIQINGWRLTLRGNPSTGDSFTIEGVLSNPVLVDAVRQRLGSVSAIRTLPQQAMLCSTPVADEDAVLWSPLGAPASAATWASHATAQPTTGLENAHRGVSCVNPDDEAARLFQLQQSYQTAAHFLQIAQSTLDKLLQAVQADNEEPS